ncbi:MAG: hypothetical protein AAGC74_04005 [Verrucomicrobiota bacterium]
MTANTNSLPLDGGVSGGLPEKFMTALVVENTQAACESLADTLQLDANEHATINDCISACDEFNTAVARDSQHLPRYAAWCIERCAAMAAVCDELGDGTARRCRRWCHLLMQELNREVLNWQDVKNVMNQDVTWEGVKNVANQPVKFPWSG